MACFRSMMAHSDRSIMLKYPACFLFIILCVALTSIGHAKPEEEVNSKPVEKAGQEKEKAKESDQKSLQEKTSETRHTGQFNGVTLEYIAKAGTLVIAPDEKEETPEASIFYVAYTKADVEDPAERPIVFCFNGGPGSSSVWLHLGGFGPKRVAMNRDGTMPPPPFRLTDNPASILRVADLVFIDPVSTGYSRAEEEKKAGEFHGFQGDLESMAEFIRLYTSRNERWLSPKFLAGESYGALRAAGLAYVLQEDFGLYLNGLILVSGVLSFDTLRATDLSYITFLPALSEVAAWHDRLDAALLADPDARREEVEEFARGEYAAGLLKGGRLEEEEKSWLAGQVARYIGLDAETVERHELRISASFFREELLREEGLVLGRFDGRITAEDGDVSGDSPRFDPSWAAVYGPFSAALNDYVRRDLEFESDLVYEILTDRVRPWNYGNEFIGQPVSVARRLAQVLTENPELQVLVNCGDQDLATPCSSIRHTIDHLDIPPGLFRNIHYTSYEGGHMMYTIEASNEAWNRDVADFIEEYSFQ